MVGAATVRAEVHKILMAQTSSRHLALMPNRRTAPHACNVNDTTIAKLTYLDISNNIVSSSRDHLAARGSLYE